MSRLKKVEKPQNQSQNPKVMLNGEQHKLFETLFTDSYSIMMIIDYETGRIVNANKAACKFYGYSYDEITQMNINQINTLSADEVKQEMHNAQSGKRNFFNFRHRTRNNEIKDVEVYSGEISIDGSPFLYSIIHDVTKRKRMEQDLIEANERYKAIHDASFGGIAIHDNGVIIECNQGLAEMTNFSAEELIGMDGFLLIAPESRDLAKSKIMSGFEEPYELKGLRKNGEKYPLLVQGRNVHYKGKRMRSTEFRDMTESNKIQAELILAKMQAEESEKKIRSMVEHTEIGILFCNPQGELIEANPAILKILGSPSVEESKKINLLTYEPLRQVGFSQNIEKCISERSVITESIVYTSKWGKTVFMKYHLVPVMLNDKITGVWANLHNLTDLWEIQNELKNSNAEYAALNEELLAAKDRIVESDYKFKMLFEQSPVGMALVDHETGDFLEVNQPILKATGYSKEEFLKLSYWDITPREYEAQEIKQIEDLNEVGHFGPNLKEYIRKDGSRFPISISGALFTDPKGKKVVWGIIEDITERKQAEEKIHQQNKELKKLNADKDRFISILAHDLKNPFNAILGFLDLLSLNIRNYGIRETEEQISIVSNAAKSTYNLLEDILTWARANSGKIPYEPQRLNFAAICYEVVESLKLTANSKQITINTHSNDEIHVFADKNMLNAVLRNLVTNAIKFTHKEGRIDIYAEKTDANVIISVTDNGVGIDPDTLNKLFDISNKIVTTGTANEKGSGLGLLLSKEFVERHSGKIWAESEVGKGSSFRFTLPLNNK